MQKEGESGRRKINQYRAWARFRWPCSRPGASPSALQTGGAANGIAVVYNPGPGFIMTAVIALTAGTMFLMWLGEQVTERGIGNGVSLIIFAGIVAGLPARGARHVRAGPQRRHERAGGDRRSWRWCWASRIFVVFVERGQRRITVNYARRQGGRSAYMNQSSFLPLKLNMSGVIPPIFASSMIMFPATACDLVQPGAVRPAGCSSVAQTLNAGRAAAHDPVCGLIIGFAFFYTALVFNSQETADNLKKSGALIPGIRPGKATADYIDGVLTRLTAAGAIYLVLVCLLPEIMRTQLGTSFYFGGTSLLIVVVVVMDFIAQIQAHLMSHQYESLLKKANLKGGCARPLSRRGWPRPTADGNPGATSPGIDPGFRWATRAASRARVVPGRSRARVVRGAGQGGAPRSAARSGQSGSVAGAWAHSPCRVMATSVAGLPSNPRPC